MAVLSGDKQNKTAYLKKLSSCDLWKIFLTNSCCHDSKKGRKYVQASTSEPALVWERSLSWEQETRSRLRIPAGTCRKITTTDDDDKKWTICNEWKTLKCLWSEKFGFHIFKQNWTCRLINHYPKNEINEACGVLLQILRYIPFGIPY